MKTMIFFSALMISTVAVAAPESLQCTARLYQIINTYPGHVLLKEETMTKEFYVDPHRPSMEFAELMIIINDEYIASADYAIGRGGANLGNTVYISRPNDGMSVSSRSGSVSMSILQTRVEMECKLVPNNN